MGSRHDSRLLSLGFCVIVTSFILVTLFTGSWCRSHHEPERHHRHRGSGTRGRRVNGTRHRQMYDDPLEDELGGFCFQENYGSPRCTKSVPVKPYPFYRMLWLDETTVANDTTGYWTGNTISVKHSRGFKEFLLVTRFEKLSNLPEKQSEFYSTYNTTFGSEKLIKKEHTPTEMNVFEQVKNKTNYFEPYKPRYVFRYGSSNVVNNVLWAPQIGAEPPGIDDREVDVASEPDCKAIRYIFNLGPRIDTQTFQLKSTPVTIYQKTIANNKVITMAKVERYQDSFYYYHYGMPILCGDRLAYIIHASLNKKKSSKHTMVISIRYFMDHMYRWVSNSQYKQLNELPVPEDRPADFFRLVG